MKTLNNKGYVLVEIILASAIAMGIAYFMMDLTLKLKNKNDDLLVKTLVATDQAIIYNTIMKDLNSSDSVTCDNINITINGNSFTYTDRNGDSFTNIVTEYAELGSYTCSYSDRLLQVTIPIKVKQLDDDFDVKIKKQNHPV